jgi:hypothetical protein
MKIIRILLLYPFEFWSVYDTEWAHRNRPCSNKTLNAPSKRQEALLVSKGRGSHVYLISSYPDMALTDCRIWLEEQRVRLNYRRAFFIV